MIVGHTMNETDRFLRRYAERHYAHHARHADPSVFEPPVAPPPGGAHRASPRPGRRPRHPSRLLLIAILIVSGGVSAIWFRPFDTSPDRLYPTRVNKNNLIERPAYSLEVDPDKSLPLWISYEARSIDRAIKRSVKDDPDVPLENQIRNNDYGDGYQRAKMVPIAHSGNISEKEADTLFFATVIAPHHNQARESAKEIFDGEIKAKGELGDVRVIRGPIYENNPIRMNGKLIPNAYFCIMVTDHRLTAWSYVNGPQKEDKELRDHEVDITTIEKATGLDFSGLPGREPRP